MHLTLPDKEIRGKKILITHTKTNIFITNKEGILLTIADLISVTSHMVIAVFITIYFYYLFHIIFVFSKNFNRLWFFMY